VQEHSNTQRTPYLYTGKELDEETGLYYYGARYYDPRTGVWVSVDPIVNQYLRGARGMGGVFNPINLSLYTYTHLNPLMFIDPDGQATGITAVLDGNKYFLVAQNRGEICQYSRCEQKAITNGLGMSQISNRGQTMYLSPTWGDNEIYTNKEQEMALNKAAEVTGDAAKVPTPVSPAAGALSAIFKAGAVLKSDDKMLAVTEAAVGGVAGKLNKDMHHTSNGNWRRTETLGGNLSEAAGEKAAGGIVKTLGDQRANSAKNRLKATEAQRQQRQQQHIQILNNGRD